MERTLWTLCAVLTLGACTGLTLGENGAGQDVALGTGAIAVDARTERAFVVRRSREIDDATGTTRENRLLYAVEPESSEARLVMDVSELTDVRILFPAGGILIMGEAEGRDRLFLLDPLTLEPMRAQDTEARYHGTRLSPSRRWLAVADNSQESAPIHILDTTTLEAKVFPHQGAWVEAAWTRDHDWFVAIVIKDLDTPAATARILMWSMEQVLARRFLVGADGYWADPVVDLTVDHTNWGGLASFTWVGVSPDDRWIAFPVSQYDDLDAKTGEPLWRYRLLILDTSSRSLQVVDDAQGPVGFTPDGATIVSYRWVGEQETRLPRLLLVDPVSLATQALELPVAGLPQYFVSHESNLVVASSFGGESSLVLYDLDAGSMRVLEGPSVHLHEFVSRPGHDELWLVDEGLHRLSLGTGELETLALPFTPGYVNLLPRADRLVVDDLASPRLLFLDPDTAAVTAEAVLPEGMTLPGG